MFLKDVNPTTFLGRGVGKVNYHPTSLRAKPIFKPKIDQADHFRPKSCFTVCMPISVAYVILYLPKLTGTLSSDTGIGWKNPVFKTLLPKTKFRVGASVVTICAALNDSCLGRPS